MCWIRTPGRRVGFACAWRVGFARRSLVDSVLQTLSFRVTILLFGLVLRERGAVGVRILPENECLVVGVSSGGAPEGFGRR